MNINTILEPVIPIVLIGLAILIPSIAFILFLIHKNGFKGEFDEEQKGKTQYNYRKKQFFMTNAEHDCYKALVQAVGNEYFIFAQVHLPTIVDEKISDQDWRAARAHINRKSVDFVLCDKEFISPKLAIELDDWSHSREDRKERDVEVERLLAQAGMPLLRITDTQDLSKKIFEILVKT